MRHDRPLNPTSRAAARTEFEGFLGLIEEVHHRTSCELNFDVSALVGCHSRRSPGMAHQDFWTADPIHYAASV
jgi:hypothetical protein